MVNLSLIQAKVLVMVDVVIFSVLYPDPVVLGSSVQFVIPDELRCNVKFYSESEVGERLVRGNS